MENHEEFLLLFPQYQARFNTYSDQISTLVRKMIDLSNGSANKFPDPLSKNIEDRFITSSRTLYKAFTTKIRYNLTGKTDEQKVRVFTEYILHQDHLEMFIQLFN
jgi:hypothetical protein